MTDPSIEDLLHLLPETVTPDADFEADLRRRLTAELHGVGTGAATPEVIYPRSPEVLELQSATAPPTAERRMAGWARAAAAAVVVATGVAVAAVATHDEGSISTTDLPADATFVGASVERITLDQTGNDPYFVAADDGAWVVTLAGDLIRVEPSGTAVWVDTVPEASPVAVDDNALWIADAVDGRVLRLDPDDGSVVARIETGVDVQPSTFRIPMREGESRQFSLIGGIVADGKWAWVGDKAGRVLRIDPATNEIVDSFDVPVRPDQLQIDGDHLLVVNLTGGEVAVVHATSGEVIHTAEVDDLAGAAVHGSALYLQNFADGTVTRIDLDNGETVTSRPLGPSITVVGQPVLVTGLVATSNGVLVDTSTQPDSLHILDPDTLQEIGSLATPTDHGDMTVAPDGSVWLVRAHAHTLLHITPSPLATDDR